jgi:hypothetical protein
MSKSSDIEIDEDQPPSSSTQKMAQKLKRKVDKIAQVSRAKAIKLEKSSVSHAFFYFFLTLQFLGETSSTRSKRKDT